MILSRRGDEIIPNDAVMSMVEFDCLFNALLYEMDARDGGCEEFSAWMHS